MKPKKYAIEMQRWFDTDLFPNCMDKVIICPQCGHLGHHTLQLNQNITHGKLVQVIRYTQHSHFIHDTDKGRHVVCEIHRFFVDPSVACDVYYRLKGRKNMPKWLRKQLYGDDAI